jgi:tetratricopeptide (TPR) repeat protein
MLFLLLSFNLFALEISIDSAKDEFSKYSVLHLYDPQEFYCQEILNDYEVTTEIVCAFSKRPMRKIQTIQNDFFTVTSTMKKGTFFLSIKPNHKIKLICEYFDLSKENTVFNTAPGASKRWNIVGYKDKLPLILKDEKVEAGINFPFFLDKDKLPFVGSLDIKGNPVHIKRVGDVKEYINIKKYYKEKKYEKCLEVIEDIIEEYPDTLFKAELVYYKIKVFSELKDFENVVEESKFYLREYSSNENVPEVLSLAANSYAKIGLLTDAEYFFDRLFSEHQGTVASEWGFIYMGDMQESNGATSKAKEYFKKALMQTSDLEVAATAAYRLATLTQSIDSLESAGYIEKILNAKPDFFMENLVSADKMMYSFADESHYKIAASMAEAIFNKMDPSYDEYEEYLSNIALWLAKTEDKTGALKALNKYIDAFPDGDYIQEIEVVKDALFFDTPDLNASAKLAEYEKLIETYSNDTIGNRAVYERAKLLYELGDFSQIIQTKDELLHLDAEV